MCSEIRRIRHGRKVRTVRKVSDKDRIRSAEDLTDGEELKEEALQAEEAEAPQAEEAETAQAEDAEAAPVEEAEMPQAENAEAPQAEDAQAEKAEAETAPESGDAPSETAEDIEAETEEGGKGMLPGRRLKKELAKKEEELASLTDRYMRTLAEYENFRKRTEKEKSDLYSYAVKDVMTKILPVLDNLERGMAAIPEEGRDDPVAEGMDKILKQFVKALDDIGVKPIEAEGQSFDPNLHNAVMHVEDESLGENVVAEELLKGYTYRDTVVRHAMVKVAN